MRHPSKVTLPTHSANNDRRQRDDTREFSANENVTLERRPIDKHVGVVGALREDRNASTVATHRRSDASDPEPEKGRAEAAVANGSRKESGDDRQPTASESLMAPIRDSQ